MMSTAWLSHAFRGILFVTPLAGNRWCYFVLHCKEAADCPWATMKYRRACCDICSLLSLAQLKTALPLSYFLAKQFGEPSRTATSFIAPNCQHKLSQFFCWIPSLITGIHPHPFLNTIRLPYDPEPRQIFHCYGKSKYSREG
ncbi:hypothetical protein BDW75DRAFT_214422 [Aspergillus navahoensis]